MERNKIYEIIDSERNYQDEKWGGVEHDENKSVGDYLIYMETYLHKARTIYTSDLPSMEALQQLRKVVALGVACFEIHGIIPRNTSLISNIIIPVEPIKVNEPADNYIPIDLMDAVNYILSKVPADELEKLKTTDKSTFIGNTHHFLGRNIRNQWGLWYNENELTKWFSSIGVNHGDDRSGMILDSVYNIATGKPIDIEGQVEKYKKHWKEAGFKDGIHPQINKN